MPTSAADTYAPSTYRLEPHYRADLATMQHVKLANGTYARGAVLGETTTAGTFDHVADTVIAAPTAAPQLTTPTGGSLAAGDYIVGYTYVDADGNETALSPTTSATAASADVVHVAAVTPLPTGVSSVNWYMSRAEDDPNLAFVLNNDGSAADLDEAPDADAADPPSSNQTGRAKAILKDACTVSGGVITLADDSTVTRTSAPVYVGGGAIFRTDQMSGLTAAAVEQLGARLISGTVADGLLRF